MIIVVVIVYYCCRQTATTIQVQSIGLTTTCHAGQLQQKAKHKVSK